jgi:dihydrofolate reductase
MRKLKLQVQISVDGFICGPNGEMDWITWNWGDDIKKYVTSLTESVDTIFLGRKLAEGFIPHWQNVVSNPDNPEHEFGKEMINRPKFVFSKTLNKSLWDNTTVINGDLLSEIKKIKEQSGKDLPSGKAGIIVYGGASFVSSLIKESLIDEFYLFVNPTAIGKGKPIFSELNSKQTLSLVESKSFDCGINLLCYTVNKK